MKKYTATFVLRSTAVGEGLFIANNTDEIVDYWSEKMNKEEIGLDTLNLAFGGALIFRGEEIDAVLIKESE